MTIVNENGNLQKKDGSILFVPHYDGRGLPTVTVGKLRLPDKYAGKWVTFKILVNDVSEV